MNQLNLFNYETDLLNEFKEAVVWSPKDPNRNIYLVGYVINRRGVVKNTRTGKILRGRESMVNIYKEGQRYITINLQVEGQGLSFPLHRIIACTFVKCLDREKQLVVNHIDHNKRNNHYSNLEWCTYKENMEKWAEQYYNSNDENQLKLL